jgi:hypothetical protein
LIAACRAPTGCDADAVKRSVSYFTQREISFRRTIIGELSDTKLFDKSGVAVDPPFVLYRLPLPISDLARSDT